MGPSMVGMHTDVCEWLCVCVCECASVSHSRYTISMFEHESNGNKKKFMNLERRKGNNSNRPCANTLLMHMCVSVSVCGVTVYLDGNSVVCACRVMGSSEEDSTSNKLNVCASWTQHYSRLFVLLLFRTPFRLIQAVRRSLSDVILRRLEKPNTTQEKTKKKKRLQIRIEIGFFYWLTGWLAGCLCAWRQCAHKRNRRPLLFELEHDRSASTTVFFLLLLLYLFRAIVITRTHRKHLCGCGWMHLNSSSSSSGAIMFGLRILIYSYFKSRCSQKQTDTIQSHAQHTACYRVDSMCWCVISS